jgi:hypothetical protein
MADDPLAKFTSRVRPKPDGVAPPQPTLPPSLTHHEEADGRHPYEAFENQVRAMNVEVRCYRSGLSHSIPYAHMSGILFEFLNGRRLQFNGGGFGVTIIGRNLRDMVLALNLHTCGFIQEYSPAHHILPQPDDPKAPFVERIDVVPLRQPPQADPGGPKPSEKT